MRARISISLVFALGSIASAAISKRALPHAAT
jgi:hypothetical protein